MSPTQRPLGPTMPISTTPIALLAVAVIVALAQLLGGLAARLGQPRVLGDIVGEIGRAHV